MEISGSPAALQEFCYWFPHGDIHVMSQAGRVYIGGSGLSRFVDEALVQERAAAALAEFSAIVSFLWPWMERSAVAVVHHEDPEDRHHRYRLASDGGTPLENGPGVPESTSSLPQPLTLGQQLLEVARTDEHLRAALSLWVGPRTWEILSQVLPEIEHSLGGPADKLSLCTMARRTLFWASARAAEGLPPLDGEGDRWARPMTLVEGVWFIHGLLSNALHRRLCSLPLAEGSIAIA